MTESKIEMPCKTYGWYNPILTLPLHDEIAPVLPLLFVVCLNLGILVVKAAAGLLFWKGQAGSEVVFVGLNGSWHPPAQDGEAILGQWPPGWIEIRQLMFSSGILSLLCKQRHCSASVTQLLFKSELGCKNSSSLLWPQDAGRLHMQNPLHLPEKFS